MPEEYSLYRTYEKMDSIVKDLEKIAPNPITTRVIEYDKEYTPQELRDLLQRFGSFLSTIHPLEARIEAECYAIREALKTGMAICIANLDEKGTVKDREAMVMASNEGLRKTRMLQIDNESSLIIVQGWRKAYESAYSTTSRLITLALGEAEFMSSRVP